MACLSKIILVMAVWSCGLAVGPKHIGCIMHSSCCIGDLSWGKSSSMAYIPVCTLKLHASVYIVKLLFSIDIFNPANIKLLLYRG